jgi:hypothetical protein
VSTLKRISLLLALGACLATAGCGSGDEEGEPIPAETAVALDGQLGEAEARLANGSFGAGEDILDDTMPEVGRILDGLPSDVDPDVRDALEESFDNLWSLVESKCQELKPDEPPQTESTPEPEPTPTETEPEPEPTETTPPPTDTTTNPEDAPLPDDGDGNGNGNGNGGEESGGVVPDTGAGGGVGPSKVKDKVKTP